MSYANAVRLYRVAEAYRDPAYPIGTLVMKAQGLPDLAVKIHQCGKSLGSDFMGNLVTGTMYRVTCEQDGRRSLFGDAMVDYVSGIMRRQGWGAF